MSTSKPHVVHQVDDYLHDLLSLEEALHVEEHCAACAACGRALEQARRRLGLLQGVPPAEPSTELVRSTLDRVDRYEKRQRTLQRRFAFAAVGSLAAMLLVLVGLQAYYTNLKPTGYDVVV